MKKNIITLLFCFLMPGVQATEVKGTPEELRAFLHPDDRVVFISGQAEETAYSDKAIVSLIVKTEDRQLSIAIDANKTLRTRIIDNLTGAGIEPGNINNSKFSSSPQYGWFDSKPNSYEVVNRVAITIFKESHLNEIAKIVDQFEEVELASTRFEHTRKDEYLAMVKSRALDKILEQKKIYEQQLGVKLKPVGFREDGIRYAGTRGAYALEEVVITGSRVRKSREAPSPLATVSSQATDNSFDEVKYDANITVQFKITE